MQKSYSCLNLKVRFCNSTSINVAIATSQMQAKLPAWVKVNKITYWLAYWLNLLTSGKAMEFEHSEDDLSPHCQDGIGCDSSVWQWTARADHVADNSDVLRSSSWFWPSMPHWWVTASRSRLGNVATDRLQSVWTPLLCRIPWSDGLSTKSLFVQSLNTHLVFVRLRYPTHC